MIEYRDMECHITDGPRDPDDIPKDYVIEDEDTAYERDRQERIDELDKTLLGIGAITIDDLLSMANQMNYSGRNPDA